MKCNTVLLLVLGCSVCANCQIPQGPPTSRHIRSSDPVLDDNRDLNEAAFKTLTTSSTSTKTADSTRQGRVNGPSSSIQSHKSTVKYANGNSRAGPSGPLVTGKINPPAPPTDDGPFPPAPPIEVSDIRCLKMASRERFSAVISIASPVDAVAPILEDRPTVNPQTSRVCQIAPAERGSYKLEISNLEACGVIACPQGDQSWLCLSLRFPVLAGLKLPEDEIVLIRCKPQDRTVTEKKDLDFNGAEVEQRSPVTFSGGKQEFVCEIGLFRRLPGTALFSQRVQAGTAVELGEEVQLRSIVRSNDGWFYSKMTDVAIRRLKKSNSIGNGHGEASLVFADGCRNPLYKAIAPQHPQRDARSALLHHFNFRVFLFQDMEDGDSVLISARVIACVEAIDCAPTLCGDDRGMGYGKRRRRSTSTSDSDADGTGKMREILVEHILYSNGTSVPVNRNLKGWEADLALKVAMPGELQPAALIAPLSNLESHCFLYLMSTVAMATALGVTALLGSFYCVCRRKRNRKDDKPLAAVNTQQHPVPLVPLAAGTPSIDSLVQACYPELQVLDAISRSVRQKKQQVHEQILNLYTKQQGPYSNHYSEEPTSNGIKSGTVKQIKRGSNNRHHIDQNVTRVSIGNSTEAEERVYWEIGNNIHQALPPTPV